MQLKKIHLTKNFLRQYLRYLATPVLNNVVNSHLLLPQNIMLTFGTTYILSVLSDF